MEEKSWRTWKSYQNIVMDEELVQNVAMGEKIVKNFVMDAKIDPKVEMDLHTFKISGWSIPQHSKRKLLAEFIEEDELQLLLIGILSRDSFLMMQYLERHLMSVDSNVKKLMSLSEDIHLTTQGYMQLHDVESRHEHPGGHTSWRESTTMRFMNIQMGHSKMRSDSSEYMWDTTGAIINSWRIKNSFGELLLKNMPRKFGGEIGWILMCMLCCRTRTICN